MTLKKSHSSLLKISTGIIAGVASINTLLMIFSYASLSKSLSFEVILGAHLLLGAIIGVVLFLIWNRQEKKWGHISLTLPGILQGFIRWWLAFQISLYGFAKILKTQFHSVPYRYDMPVGDLSGFSLTWFYYGYSYPLAVIIGLIQIAGSILLLFRSTTLIGVIMLLPVMVNIILINGFYHISPGAFLNSVVYTVALSYLIGLDFPRLKEAISGYRNTLLPVKLKSPWTKNLLRITPVALALGGILFVVLDEKSDTVLYGAYQVDSFKRNEQLMPTDAWVRDSTVFSKVYFSGPQGCAFSPNPYRYKPQESLRGDYQFDEKNKQLDVVYYYGAHEDIVDSVTYTVTDHTPNRMTLKGIWNRDTLEMKLTRIR